MGKEGTGKLVSVEGACLGGISSDQALGGLDPDLGSLVRPGVVAGGHPVELLHHL